MPADWNYLGMEVFHYDDDYVYYDFQFGHRRTVKPDYNAWYYRKFCDASNNCTKHIWGRRRFTSGTSIQVAVSSWSCKEGETKKTPPRSTPTVLLHGSYLVEPIYNATTGQTDTSVYAIAIEHRRELKTERYWYGRHKDPDGTWGYSYGLIRWDLFCRESKPGGGYTPWTYASGGCQVNTVVPYSVTPAIPWSIIDEIDGATQCVDICN